MFVSKCCLLYFVTVILLCQTKIFVRSKCCTKLNSLGSIQCLFFDPASVEVIWCVCVPYILFVFKDFGK